MVAADAPRIVVCDAGPLIHLDELKCIDLLADFQEILVPEAVWNEVARHRPSALRRRSVRLQRTQVVSQPDVLLKAFAESLSLANG